GLICRWDASTTCCLSIFKIGGIVDGRLKFSHYGPSVTYLRKSSLAVHILPTNETGTEEPIELDDPTELRNLPNSLDITSFSLSADGEYIAIRSPHPSKAWICTKNLKVYTLIGHSGQVWNIDFLGESNKVISTAYDGTMRVWDLE